MFGGELPDTPLKDYASGAVLIETLSTETRTAPIPPEFSFVGFEQFGTDLMPAAKCGTSSYADALQDPTKDVGPIVLVGGSAVLRGLACEFRSVADDLTPVPRDDPVPRRRSLPCEWHH